MELSSLFWSGTSFLIPKSFPRRPLQVHIRILLDRVNKGFCIAVMGQTFRSLAMIHAASNFNHTVQTQKDPTHVLVTSGVYSLVRHPSYFGFFWWAVGLQLFLANPITAILFTYVLWNFFSNRIKYISEYLLGLIQT